MDIPYSEAAVKRMQEEIRRLQSLIDANRHKADMQDQIRSWEREISNLRYSLSGRN